MRGRKKGNKNSVRRIFYPKKKEVKTDEICLHFGCGKKLSGFEVLAGNYCFKHAQEISQSNKSKSNMNYES